MSEKQRAAVEVAAQKVLAVRAEFLVGTARCAVPARASQPSAGGPEIPLAKTGKAPAGTSQRDVPTHACTLADLYDPLATPPALQKAHEELDRAVDKCYRPEPFTSERQRVEFLFALYEKLTAPLLPAAKSKRKTKNGK